MAKPKVKAVNLIIRSSLDDRYKRWLPLLLLMLLLSGCSGRSNAEKPVFYLSIRANRVEAQTQSNNIYAANPVSRQRALPAPTVQPSPTATPAPSEETVTTVLPPVLPTPTPPLIPLGRPDRVVIPSIAVDAPIKSVYAQRDQVGDQWFQNWDTAANAAGYHESSALLGQPGNTVISGHNNIDGSVFRSLYLLQPGTEILLYANGYRYTYIVEDQFIVPETGVSLEQRLQNASWIGTTIDERVTLVSCWPPEGNSHRVIVVARPVQEN